MSTIKLLKSFVRFLVSIICLSVSCNCIAQENQITSGNSKCKGYVRVSKKNPRYFELTTGEAYIPCGMNICFPRFLKDEAEVFADYEKKFKMMSEAGGNYARIWLSAPFWQIEDSKQGEYNPKKLARIDELVITSLRGIDFPVYVVGGKTEGKNVGMTTTVTEYKGRQFQFSPITFRLSNAKGFGDYPDGIEPDVVLDNQDATSQNDVDNMFPYSFGDWGSYHFNPALSAICTSILGTQPASVQTKGAPSAATDQFAPIGEPGPWLHKANRFGNQIY